MQFKHKPKYLSPSSIALFFQNRQEFYMQKIARKKLNRIPQTPPMAVGSAFDAYIKSYLHKSLGFNDPRFEFETIFEEQVEPLQRDWAREAGEYVFKVYKALGGPADLLAMMLDGKGEPRFEFTLEGPFSHKEANIDNVILLGKPDLYFVSKEDVPVILDWKVNGFCGKYDTRPKKGYVKLRSRSANNRFLCHPEAMISKIQDIPVNKAAPLDHVDQSWARQLTIYAWLLGQKPGDQFVVRIDQLCCGPNIGDDRPDISIAEHCTVVSKNGQERFLEEIRTVWEAIHDPKKFFPELSEEESLKRCQEMEDLATFLDEETEFRDMGARWL